MIDELLPCLRCPHCARDLERVAARVLGCAGGHRYDEAKQGYVTLLPPRTRNLIADDADMIAARLRTFAAGHFAPLHRAVAAAASAFVDAAPGVILDAGCGPGTYLAEAVRACAESPETERHRAGLGFDLSTAAARRAARVHPRVGSVVADTFSPWPLRSGVASVVLDVFAPRNGEEMHRVLAPGGHLVVATPEAPHLQELRAGGAVIGIDEHKAERLAAALGPYFDLVAADHVRWTMMLDRQGASDVAGMGPSKHHREAGKAGSGDPGVDVMPVTGHVRLGIYRRKDAPDAA